MDIFESLLAGIDYFSRNMAVFYSQLSCRPPKYDEGNLTSTLSDEIFWWESGSNERKRVTPPRRRCVKLSRLLPRHAPPGEKHDEE